MSETFGEFIFWQISRFKQKSAISDVALCVLCTRALHSDLQVIHGDFRLFSTLHCSWCVSEYKLVLLLFDYALTNLINMSLIHLSN